MRGFDAALGDVDVLRRRTHLSGVQRQRERDVAHHALEVTGRVDDDLVDPSLFCEHMRLYGIALQPRAVGAAAGEVDEAHLWVQRQRRGRPIARVVGNQGNDVRIEARLLEDFARHFHSDGQGKDRARVGLHHDRIAGGQAREQAGITVPGREGAAANHQSHAAWDDCVALFHLERLILTLGLLPVGALRDAAHLFPGVGHRFQPAVLGVRAAGLERHHEGLARGMHDCVGDLEALLVQPLQDLQRHADPRFRSGLAPGG